MFKLESYITPILLNYVAKYVKNIKDEDAQISLWEGEVCFQNLELRLDVLEKELNLPVELVSGHIHELCIQVPWTKLMSEPIKIIINTIEFVAKLRTVQESSSSHKKNKHPKAVPSVEAEQQQQQQQQSSTTGSGMVNKIINNISIECKNIILKYVEEDIVVSMNVQVMQFTSANENWKPAMTDVNPVKVFMRKLLQVTDLTICLDKRNAAGRIDVCQEPVLYRCTLECRILRKYNVNNMKTTSTTRIGIFTKALDLNVSSLQFPMVMRLVKLMIELKSTEGHPNRTAEFFEEIHKEEQERFTPETASYLSWAWNLLPSFISDSGAPDLSVDDEPLGHVLDIGVYAEELNFQLKNSEYIHDHMMGGTKRIRYTPIMKISLGGMYYERASVEERYWGNVKAGLSSICIEPLGPYRSEEQAENTFVDTMPFQSERAFVDKSLFDEQYIFADKSWCSTNYEDYSARITDEYMLYRSPVLAFDVVEYRSPAADEDSTDFHQQSADRNSRVQYRVLSAGITLHYSNSLLQVKKIINDFVNSYDYPAYYAEKSEIGHQNKRLNQTLSSGASAPGMPSISSLDIVAGGAGGVAGASSGAVPGGSGGAGTGASGGATVKLPPPSIEDYEELMNHVPNCNFRFVMKNMSMLFHAKIQRRIGSSGRFRCKVKHVLPFFLLKFGYAEGTLCTPQNPQRIVATTSQLKDKPRELLDNCYDNYKFFIKNISLTLENASPDGMKSKLVIIPKLQFNYSKLLMQHLWNLDEVSIQKVDVSSEVIILDFTKRELIIAIRLMKLLSNFDYQELMLLARQVSEPLSETELLKLSSNFAKFRINYRHCLHYDKWLLSVRNMQSDVHHSKMAVRSPVLTTWKGQFNKWLEVQCQYPIGEPPIKQTNENVSNEELNSYKPINNVFAFWMEQFRLCVDVHLLQFLRYKDVQINLLNDDSFDEVELQTTNLQVSSQFQLHGVQLNPSDLGERYHRGSRGSTSSRRISPPAETIHNTSSERDDRPDPEAGASPPKLPPKDPSEAFKRTKFFKSLILNVEIASSKIQISESLHRNKLGEITNEYTAIVLPKVLWRSEEHDSIIRSNIKATVQVPMNKPSLKWTIELSNIGLYYQKAEKTDKIIGSLQTTIIIAMSHRIAYQHIIDKQENEEKHSGRTINSVPDEVDPTLKRFAADFTVPSQISAEESFEKPKKVDWAKETQVRDDNANRSKRAKRRVEIVSINLHIDTSPIHFSGRKLKPLYDNIRILLMAFEFFHPVTYVDASEDESQQIRIVTQSEKNHKLKEFLDYDCSSESSNISATKQAPTQIVVIFCQWTIPRITVELESYINQRLSKIVLEAEDLLLNMDKHPDFTKYTTKIENFSLNYFESTAEVEWKTVEYLRIKTYGDQSNMPFLTFTKTIVSLQDLYSKIGVKQNAELDRTMSEILVSIQAIEIILDIDRIAEFLGPLCEIFEIGAEEKISSKANKEKGRIVTAADLPMIHFESKGIILYIPMDIGQECCTFMIAQIESITLTPNLENPLQRSPIRTDVFSKAAQMGILGTPGALIEDRQYELSLRNISLATGNWEKALMSMRQQSSNLHRTNPAFEWNNQNRKAEVKLANVFNNFTFIITYAPAIAYNNVLICGQAIELNCASDFVASLETNQILFLSCVLIRLQRLSSIIKSTCNLEDDSKLNHMSFRASIIASLNVIPDEISSEVLSDESLIKKKSVVYKSVYEEAQYSPRLDSAQSDSGILDSKVSSEPQKLKLKGSVKIKQEEERNIPQSLSLVAGIFIIKVLDVHQRRNMFEQPLTKPIISITVSQPSFMITQNIFDSVRQASVFNFNVHVPSSEQVAFADDDGYATNHNSNLFPEVLIGTYPGNANSSGIPPPLFSYKAHFVKQLEIDIELHKPLLINLHQACLHDIVNNLIALYAQLVEKQCASLRSENSIVRCTKIYRMQLHCLNADRLHIKCDRIVIKFFSPNLYKFKAVISDLKFNVNFYSHPEKAVVKGSVGALFIQLYKKIFMHPVAVRASINIVSEEWCDQPLIHGSFKFNVINFDISILMVLEMRAVLEGAQNVREHINSVWQNCLRNRPIIEAPIIQRECLQQLRPISHHKIKTSQMHVEFYQDDLRAGAFQFVELFTDSLLPMPYQIQIIKKNYGIICWRYPQPRQMCRVDIYPVPMPVNNPVQIKCRMEYFSVTHECFLPFCDFLLSETSANQITLPEREICANIWRVVIMQSLVSVNGEHFENSEEDEELHSIASSKIDEVYKKDEEHDFILHPKVLVGCMRIDTSFHSKAVPKLQILVCANGLVIKLQNQPDAYGEFPEMIKRFRLQKTTEISQSFLSIFFNRVNLYGAFYSEKNYALDANLCGRVKCLDYGFLNMIDILEPYSLHSFVRVNDRSRTISANVIVDKLRVNFGPAIVHSLVTSKQHWDELLDANRRRYPLIPKCVIINRTQSMLSFGQSGTNERIQLSPRECQLYYFRSDYHNQEITFFLIDDETQITDASPSVPIPFKFDGDYMSQHVRIGNKCVTIKSTKLSATQIYVVIKGQIEMLSMVPQEFVVEFRSEGKKSEDHIPIEYRLEQHGRATFYRTVHRSSNIVMRLKLVLDKARGRTGDIPLKPNKNLPWLVKVPIVQNEFMSIWIRVLREDITIETSDSFQPQKLLITIWPIFSICNMLSCGIQGVESTTAQEFQVEGRGGRFMLNTPTTHVTDHKLDFKFKAPVSKKSKTDYTLMLKSVDWQKFFYYDESEWTIKYALSKLSKGIKLKWPIQDDEELRVERESKLEIPTDIIYSCDALRDFSCTMNLTIAPWAMFINATGINTSISFYKTNKRFVIESNHVEMLGIIDKGFTIDVPYGSNWVASKPIYLEELSHLAEGKSHHVLRPDASIDICVVRGDDVNKFVLELKFEKERRIFKLRSKYVITNFTGAKVVVLPFAMDHKESAQRLELDLLNNARIGRHLRPVANENHCIGASLDVFYDIKARKTQRSNDTAFVYFVCFKVSDDSDFSIPIPLAMPFTRRCFSVQDANESTPFVVNLIENNGIFYLNIFNDKSPAIIISNNTNVQFIVAHTTASEHSNVTNTTPEYNGRHFEWYQFVLPQSKCYYTPAEVFTNFPDVDFTLCNLTLALCNKTDYPTKKYIKWSKPICTNRSWKKFLHVPNHGDVKVVVCDKHRITRVSIYYVSQQMEFSVKELRSRMLLPHVSNVETEKFVEPIKSLQFGEKPKEFVPTLDQLSEECAHFSNACDTKRQLRLRCYVKEVVFSLHTDSRDRDFIKTEVCGVYIDDFMLIYDDDDDKRQLNILLANFQIDNQLHSSGDYDFPVLLCAQNLYRRTKQMPHVLNLDAVYKELISRTPLGLFTFNFFMDEHKLCSITNKLSPIRIYIEDAYLNSLLDALVECAPSNCVYTPHEQVERIPLVEGQMLIPKDVAIQARWIADPLQLRCFTIEPISILLSVHTSLRLYIALDHSPLSFSSYERQQVLTLPLRFGQSLGMHYLSGAIFGAGWVVGSLEILGSPSGLARSFSTGLRDFVSMPLEGLFRGPWGFVVGVTQGSASLLRNITAGTVNSVTKLASSVARNLDRLSLDPEHIERTEALRRSRPQGFTDGLTQGMTGLGISILGAVGGLAHHTLEATSPVGVIAGLSKGIVGVVTKPISGAAEMVALAGQGMLQTVGFNAMPHQCAPSIGHNIAVNPSSYRIWKLLPNELNTDQILFYGEITLVIHRKFKRGFVFLTSAVFAIMEAEFDKLTLVVPIDKVELVADKDDKTFYHVHITRDETDDIEEHLSYTNQRIMKFLHASSVNIITADSLDDLLLNSESINSRTTDWSFYISQHLGEHLILYLKIVNKIT